MYVNVKELDVKYKELLQYVDNYESNILNYYNELNTISNNWEDGHSLSFFSGVEKTKKDINKHIVAVKFFCKIYGYIVEKYQEICDEDIEFNLNTVDKLVQKNDDICLRIDDVLRKYYGLGELESYLRDILYQQVKKIREIREGLNGVKDSNKDVMDTIREIELVVGNKLSKVRLFEMQDEVYDDGIKYSGNVMMNTDDVDVSIKKLDMYKKEEDLIVEDIKNILKEMDLDYRTEHRDKVSEVASELLDNFEKILVIHGNNILKIDKHKNEYIDSALETKRKFEKMGDISL